MNFPEIKNNNNDKIQPWLTLALSIYQKAGDVPFPKK